MRAEDTPEPPDPDQLELPGLELADDDDTHEIGHTR